MIGLMLYVLTDTSPEAPVPSWLSYALGALIAVLIALLLAPLIPEPGGQIVAIIAYIVAAILAVLALVALLRGSRV